MKFLYIIFLSTGIIFADDPNKVSSEYKLINFEELKKISSTKIVDTLYTLSDYFVEIDLTKQLGYLHSRSDSIKTFKVSTGTRKIKDGVETNTGIFVIQHKAPKWYSTQFDSTLMLHWMGFNYGIGFHALAGKSYYKYLGKKTSSHGCIRVSKEDAKELFAKLTYGSPVLIHKGQTAVKIAFADKHSSDYKYYDRENLLKETGRRLTHLYKGSYLNFVNEKILIDHQNVTHQGLSIGEIKKVAVRQRIYPDSLFLELAVPEIRAQFIPVRFFSVEKLFASN
ncbi:MAG: L,D-transpeptidase [Ignavibacterium album]|uniref:L,D-transpeptidase n=1 Tax=Ignavibacterium album TaxID=591197 RepID=UPI0026EB1C0B|nr:L,D-transpeptidase [Ignavibacterium album]MBI5662092.1 L,D-transpeptidase [Ignavibacterium album]